MNSYYIEGPHRNEQGRWRGVSMRIPPLKQQPAMRREYCWRTLATPPSRLAFPDTGKNKQTNKQTAVLRAPRVTWNVRSMNQSKLEVVKLKMARVNIDILGISELRWTGMGELTQMTIISTNVGRNPYKKWSSHHSQQKSLKCSTWMQSQKRQNDLCSFPRQTIQYHGNPSLCPGQ